MMVSRVGPFHRWIVLSSDNLERDRPPFAPIPLSSPLSGVLMHWLLVEGRLTLEMSQCVIGKSVNERQWKIGTLHRMNRRLQLGSMTVFV